MIWSEKYISQKLNNPGYNSSFGIKILVKLDKSFHFWIFHVLFTMTEV